MRGFLLALVCALGILATVPATSSASVATHQQPAISAAVTTPVFAVMQAGDKKIDINISTGSSGGARWYKSPVWIAIMVIGGVLVLFMLAMVVRGGN